jgi:hypothetical protein
VILITVYRHDYECLAQKIFRILHFDCLNSCENAPLFDVISHLGCSIIIQSQLLCIWLAILSRIQPSVEIGALMTTPGHVTVYLSHSGRCLLECHQLIDAWSKQTAEGKKPEAAPGASLITWKQ